MSAESLPCRWLRRRLSESFIGLDPLGRHPARAGQFPSLLSDWTIFTDQPSKGRTCWRAPRPSHTLIVVRSSCGMLWRDSRGKCRVSPLLEKKQEVSWKCWGATTRREGSRRAYPLKTPLPFKKSREETLP